jgi:Zn-dependent protease with chaperone function
MRNYARKIPLQKFICEAAIKYFITFVWSGLIMKKICCLTIHLLLLFPLIAVKAQSPVWNFQKHDSILANRHYRQAADTTNFLIQSSDKKLKSEYKKIYSNRLEQIKLVLTSHRAVTDPQVVSYLQSIVEKITAGNAELKNLKPRILFSRDWWPNAYSMGEGTIFVNAGLFIYLKTEAELAFVLAHEMAHLSLNHSGRSVDRYVQTVNSEAFQSELKRLAKEQYMVNRQLEQLAKSVVFGSRQHSREYETEADRKAFEYLLKSGFYTGAAETVLLTLNRIDDTIYFRPLQVDKILHFTNYPFKQKWIQKESSIFSEMKEETTKNKEADTDSLKTHPDCIKRIELLQKSNPVISGSPFLINESFFKQLQTDFLVEMTEACYESGNLSLNLYYSLQMIQENRFMPYAVFSAARCMNKIYEEQKNHKLGLQIDTENKVFSGDYNLLLRMLSRIRLHELGLLNLHFCAAYAEMMKPYKGFQKEYTVAQERTF